MTRGAATRNLNIERLRVLAILDIIGFHVDPAGRSAMILGGAGLATFLLLAHLFNTLVSGRMGARDFSRLKIRRLLVPWIFWSAVYLALNVVDSLRAGLAFYAGLDPWMLTYGTFIHLWFVPFACFSGIGLAYFHCHFDRRPAQTPGDGSPKHAEGSPPTSLRQAQMILALTAIGAGLLVLCSLWIKDGDLGAPARQYLYALPSPFLGLALGRFCLLPAGQSRRVVTLVLGLFALSLIGLSHAFNWPETILKWTIAATVILALLHPASWPRALKLPHFKGLHEFKLLHEGRLITHITPLLFGCYLVHPLVVRLSLGVSILTENVWLHAFAVLIASLLVTRVLKASPLHRFI